MAGSMARHDVLSAFRKLDSSGNGTCRKDHLETAIGRILVDLFLADEGKADQGPVHYEDFLDWLFGSNPVASAQRPTSDIAVHCTAAPPQAAVSGASLFLQQARYAEARRAVRFKSHCTYSQLGWVRLQYLRDSCGALVQGRPLLRRQDLPESALVVGQAPPGVNWWVVSHPWLAKQHADITGEQLLGVLDKLDKLGARGEDVVFLDYLSMFQKSLSGEDDRSPEQKSLFKRSLQIINDLYSSPFCKVVIVTTIPPSARLGPHEVDIQGVRATIEPNSVPYVQRGWCYFELFVALLFRRHTQLDDDCLHAVENLVADIFSNADITDERERATVQEAVLTCLTSTEDTCRRNDSMFCHLVDRGTFVFLRAGYLRSLLCHGGTVPMRRQDLPLTALITNWRERRMYAAAITHLFRETVFDPDRVILSEVVQKLDLLSASDEDGVFLSRLCMDWASCEAVAKASSILPFMSSRVLCFICHNSFKHRGVKLHDRAFPLMSVLASAFSGSLIYDDSLTVDIIVKHTFMKGLRTKVFTNGTEDMDLVGNMFKALLYQRAGVTDQQPS